MRRVSSAVILLLAALPAWADKPAPNTLTPKERADGWSLLFDGEKFNAFRIEGDYQIVDGVLVIGGETDARLVTTRVLLRNFELRLQYRTETPPDGSRPNAGMDFVGNFTGGGGLWGLKPPRPDAGPDDWEELVFKGEYDPQTGAHRVSSDDPMALQLQEGLPDGASEEPKQVTVFFEVPAGSKLYLRNIKLKADPVGWWDTPWPYTALLVVGLLLFCVFLWIMWRYLRRRWTVAAMGAKG